MPTGNVQAYRSGCHWPSVGSIPRTRRTRSPLFLNTSTYTRTSGESASSVLSRSVAIRIVRDRLSVVGHHRRRPRVDGHERPADFFAVAGEVHAAVADQGVAVLGVTLRSPDELGRGVLPGTVPTRDCVGARPRPSSAVVIFTVKSLLTHRV